MAGATSLVQLILKKWGDDAAGAAKELERLAGFPESVANRIATGELPMDAESVARRKSERGGDLEFHGTRANGLLEVDPDKVDLGLHTGPVEQANNRLRQTREWADDVRGETIIPLMVRRGNEMTDMRDIGTWNDSISVAKEMDNVGYDSYGRLQDLELDREFMVDGDWLASPENRAGLDEFTETLLDDGIDSVRYQNQVENTYGSSAGLRPEFEKRRQALYDEERSLLSLGNKRKPKGPELPETSDPDAARKIEEWQDFQNNNLDSHYLTDAEKRRLDEIRDQRMAIGNDPANMADTRSTISLRPENLRSPNAAFDPQYTGPNIMGNADVGLLTLLASGSAGAGVLLNSLFEEAERAKK